MKKILCVLMVVAMVACMAACGSTKVASGVEDGVLTVGMECAYAPYNWTQTDADEVLGVTELPDRYIKNGVKNGKWGDEFPNCIDPTVFYDDEGNLWMAYGSWSGGIFMLELDETTGLRDYSVTYETNEHSDAYFGKKIAGNHT